ncbi:MAG: Methyl-accepting chemotaxis protein, partial [Actinomycetota bacterium]|nr:Methyl-accepting chemotaxis protein [Actinomycetota bacterium]
MHVPSVRSRWTVGRKLAALASTGLLVAIVLGAVSYFGVVEISRAISARNRLTLLDQCLRELDAKQSDVTSDEIQAILSPEPADAQKVKALLAEDEALIARTITVMRKIKVQPRLAREASAFLKDFNVYVTASNTTMLDLLTLTPGSTESVEAMRRERDRGDEISNKITRMRGLVSESMQTQLSQINRTASSVRVSIVSCLVCGLIVLLTLSIVLTRSITRRVREMVVGLRMVANRDLRVKIDVSGNDEITDMGVAIDEAV